MSDERKEDRPVNPAAAKDDEAVQAEIQREEAEGRDLIGDTSDNRNVSGSSTWETLPPASSDAADGSA